MFTSHTITVVQNSDWPNLRRYTFGMSFTKQNRNPAQIIMYTRADITGMVYGMYMVCHLQNNIRILHNYMHESWYNGMSQSNLSSQAGNLPSMAAVLTKYTSPLDIHHTGAEVQWSPLSILRKHVVQWIGNWTLDQKVWGSIPSTGHV